MASANGWRIFNEAPSRAVRTERDHALSQRHVGHELRIGVPASGRRPLAQVDRLGVLRVACCVIVTAADQIPVHLVRDEWRERRQQMRQRDQHLVHRLVRSERVGRLVFWVDW